VKARSLKSSLPLVTLLRPRLMPCLGSSRRVLGIDRGLIEMTDDFDDVDKEITDLFEGNVSRRSVKR